MTENIYRSTINEWIDPRLAHASQYNLSVIGVSKFECDIETNDLELLNELTKVVMDFAERKRVEKLKELEENNNGDVE